MSTARRGTFDPALLGKGLFDEAHPKDAVFDPTFGTTEAAGLKTVLVTAVLQRQNLTKTVEISAQLVIQGSKTVQVSAVLVGTVSKIVAISAVLLGTATKLVAATAVLQRQNLVQTVQISGHLSVFTTLTKTVAVSAMLKVPQWKGTAAAGAVFDVTTGVTPPAIAVAGATPPVTAAAGVVVLFRATGTVKQIITS